MRQDGVRQDAVRQGGVRQEAHVGKLTPGVTVIVGAFGLRGVSKDTSLDSTSWPGEIPIEHLTLLLCGWRKHSKVSMSGAGCRVQVTAIRRVCYSGATSSLLKIAQAKQL